MYPTLNKLISTTWNGKIIYIRAQAPRSPVMEEGLCHTVPHSHGGGAVSNVLLGCSQLTSDWKSRGIPKRHADRAERERERAREKERERERKREKQHVLRPEKQEKRKTRSWKSSISCGECLTQEKRVIMALWVTSGGCENRSEFRMAPPSSRYQLTRTAEEACSTQLSYDYTKDHCTMTLASAVSSGLNTRTEDALKVPTIVSFSL